MATSPRPDTREQDLVGVLVEFMNYSFREFDSFVHFILYLDWDRALLYFWAFLVIDMPRYVILDLTILFVHLPRRRRQQKAWHAARRKLFRERPLVSVIAPGKNEGKHIPALAASLPNQTYKHTELIIVDDGSDDDTPIICRRLKRQGAIDTFVRHEIRGGKASAANTALAYANGKFIVHIDADSMLLDDAIERALIPFYMNPDIGIVGGDVRVIVGEKNLVKRLQAIEYMKSIAVGRSVASTLGLLRIVAGAYGVFRTDVLRQLRGWDVGPGLDGDITLKFRKLGWKVVHEPSSVCYTNVPDSFKKLAKQRYRWDRSMVRFRMRKHVNILMPSANFRWRDFISVVENIFSSFVLNIMWWLYVISIIFFSGEFMIKIFIINYMLYFLANVFEYIVALLVHEGPIRKEDYRLAIYLPLMPLYVGLYLRSIRTYAQIMELFHKASYYDAWNPWKVSKVVMHEKL